MPRDNWTTDVLPEAVQVGDQVKLFGVMFEVTKVEPVGNSVRLEARLESLEMQVQFTVRHSNFLSIGMRR